MKQLAIKAAHNAGQVLTHYYNGRLTVKTKLSQFDLVTQADVEAEKAIVQTIKAKYPDHAFWTEESGASGNSDYVWLVDPLDGTTNFVHSFPHFCTAIALLHKKEVVLAVTFDPLRNELFVAEQGQQPTLNGTPIAVSTNQTLDKTMLAAGFSATDSIVAKTNLAYFEKLMPLTQSLRRSGSAALNMAYVACGRLDGYWELALSPWDWMGGALLIETAGGIVTNFNGNPATADEPSILAANPAIHKALQKTFHQRT